MKCKHNTFFFFFFFFKNNICEYLTLSAKLQQQTMRQFQTHASCFLIVPFFPLALRFAEWLDLDSLYCLFYILQQRFVLWTLVLLLICVHICQSRHVRVKVLFVYWILGINRGKIITVKKRHRDDVLQTHLRQIIQTLAGFYVIT